MTEGVTSNGFANYADYRNRFFHLSMNERRVFEICQVMQGSMGLAKQRRENRVAYALLLPRKISQFSSSK